MSWNLKKQILYNITHKMIDERLDKAKYQFDEYLLKFHTLDDKRIVSKYKIREIEQKFLKNLSLLYY